MTHRVQVTIPYFNSLPEDCATNVLHFDYVGVGTPTAGVLQALVDTIVLFYEGCYNDSNTCAAYADNGATQFKIFNLDDITPRAPVHESVEVMGLNSGTSTVLPPEVSVVASIHGDPALHAGVAQASLRGRVYLGVLGDAVCLASTSSSFPTVSEGFRTDVNGAANALVANAITAGWNWVIYSRKNNQSYTVTGGHCDDAFDIQRRRGQQPTIRNTWP